MTITIPTGDLCGILADCLPFTHPTDDLPVLNAVRLEWDGQSLHAMATDRYRIAWSTWDPDDEPDAEGDQQDDLFTEWGSDDSGWTTGRQTTRSPSSTSPATGCADRRAA